MIFTTKTTSYVLGMAFLCFLLAGCSTKGPLFTREQPSSLVLSASKYEVTIRDNRTRTEDREIHVPILTWPGDADQVRPKSTEILIDSFHKVASKYIEPSGTPLHFEIVIDEGLQSFENPGLGESEYVSFQLEMNVIDPTTEIIMFSSSGICWGRRWSLDASPKRIKKMYVKAFEKALIEAFEKIQKLTT